jgi:hypothetical protein
MSIDSQSTSSAYDEDFIPAPSKKCHMRSSKKQVDEEKEIRLEG